MSTQTNVTVSPETLQNEILATKSKEGKYLTFYLAGEEYGLEILKVREIIGLMDITAVPKTPDFVRGVINLRGKVIPVIELRSKFNLEHTEDTEQTCIIVVDVAFENSTIQIGVLVDSVSEVLDITGDDIEDAPSFGTDLKTDFISGMAKASGSVIILLNIENVLAASDMRLLSETERLAHA